MRRIYILAMLAGATMTAQLQAGNWHCAADFGYSDASCPTGGCDMGGGRPIYMTYSCNRTAGLWDGFCAESQQKRFGCGCGLFAPHHAFPGGGACGPACGWTSCSATMCRIKSKLACWKSHCGHRCSVASDCACVDGGCQGMVGMDEAVPMTGGCPSCGKSMPAADPQPAADAGADHGDGLDIQEQTPEVAPEPATESTTSRYRYRAPIQPVSQPGR